MCDNFSKYKVLYINIRSVFLAWWNSKLLGKDIQKLLPNIKKFYQTFLKKLVVLGVKNTRSWVLLSQCLVRELRNDCLVLWLRPQVGLWEILERKGRKKQSKANHFSVSSGLVLSPQCRILVSYAEPSKRALFVLHYIGLEPSSKKMSFMFL